MLISIVAITALLMVSAFMSGTETAMTGASRERIHHLAGEGDRRAALVKLLLEQKERLIGSLLLGNNAVNVLASALATQLLIELTGEAGVAYATVLMTLFIVVFAEVLPKTYAIRHPEGMSLFIAPAVRVLVAVVNPATWVVQQIVNGALRLFRVPVRGQIGLSTEALRGAIALHAEEGSVEKHERDMLGGVLDLADVEVGEIMTHRKTMVTIDADADPAQIVEQVANGAFTRYPVWRGDSDSVIGILHAKDLLAAAQGVADVATLDVAALTVAPWFIPDSTPLRQQLLAFRQKRQHLALVVDEYGSLLGLVTLEDILEEIVGEIADEKDVEVAGVEVQPDGAALVEGWVTVRDLNRQLDWRLPDDEAVTVAGLVIHEARRIPDAGQSFVFHDFRFDVLRRQRNQVTLLRVVPPAPRGDDGDGA